MYWQNIKKLGRTIANHAVKHTGVGIVCAVAYFDPGNWGVDLQAGSQFGYKLLFVVLLSGLFAVFLQVLASRLGCVTGLDLASQCRLLLHSPRHSHPLLSRYLLLYPLYVLSEIAIIATDLAELIGSAIALCLLFPSLQLWHGVLLTAADVVLILMMGDPLGGRPVRWFEMGIGFLVVAVLVCLVIVVSRVDVDWEMVGKGFAPSGAVVSGGGLYTSVGILGATVMPHSLFLGSALATQDRISSAPPSPSPSASSSRSSLPQPALQKPSRRARIHRFYTTCTRSLSRSFSTPDPSTIKKRAKNTHEHENNSFLFVTSHIYHGIVDVVVCLMGFAVGINSLILILASAVFYYGSTSGSVAAPTTTTTQTHEGGAAREGPASLFDAYDLIRDLVGGPAATLFAIALLAAGQSSSLIATLAGQAVSQGFLEWNISPLLRRLITRLLAIIPSIIVALSLGRSGIDALLVGSQVVLSVVLPFITLPLILVTSGLAGGVGMKVRRSRGPEVGSGSGSGSGREKEEKEGLEDAGKEKEGGVVVVMETTTRLSQEKGSSEEGGEGEQLAHINTLARDHPSTEEGTVETQTQTKVQGQQGQQEQEQTTECGDERPGEWIDYKNPIAVTLVAFAIWLVVVAANFYVLVSLGMGLQV